MASASPAMPQVMPVLLGAMRQSPDATKEDSKTGSASNQLPRKSREAEIDSIEALPRRSLSRVSNSLENDIGFEQDVEIDPNTAFTLQAELGKGSFGAVFSAVHRDTGKVYALKVLSKAVYAKNKMLSYAQTERNVHAWIRHPFIVGLHLAFQTPTSLVLVLPYCPGGSLFALIHAQAERRLPESLSRVYLAEVCLAVEHLHRHGVVHRDVKTANVIVDEDRHAMLTDFGLSKEGITTVDGARSFAGTLQYLAPEILDKKKGQGHGLPVDVYCLGAFLFEMVTGKIPFWTNGDKTAFAKAVLTEELKMPNVVSSLAERFVRDCMAKDPAKRKQAVELRVHPFFRGLSFELVLQRKVHVPLVVGHQLKAQAGKSNLVMQWVKGRLIESPFLADEAPGTSGEILEGWDFKSCNWGQPPAEGGTFYKMQQRISENRRSRSVGNAGQRNRGACLVCFWQNSTGRNVRGH